MYQFRRMFCILLALFTLLAGIAVPAVRTTADAEEISRLSDVFPDRGMVQKPAPHPIPTEAGTILFFDSETRNAAFDLSDEVPEESRIYFNSSNFPDKVFRELLKNSFGREYMTTSEAQLIRSINVTGLGISSLIGIQYFTNLEALYCGAGYNEDGSIAAKNNLKSLDVRSLKSLKTLCCDNNSLSSLNVSGMTNLNELVCDNNPLTALTFQDNNALRELYCGYTKMKSFDFSKCPGLREVEVVENGLTALNVAPLTRLEKLYCADNALTALDLSGKTTLEILSCDRNKLSTLDLTDCENLHELYCSNNKLTRIKTKSWCALTIVDCSDNQLTAISAHVWGQLSWLYCDNNKIQKLDLASKPSLTVISCDNNALTLLTLPVSMGKLSCRNNLLEEIGGNKPVYMTHLLCSGNRLHSLDLGDNVALEYLLCDGNDIPALDVSKCTKLKVLDCSDNRIEELDLSKNTALIGLGCENNRLVKLDLGANTALEEAYYEGQTRAVGALTQEEEGWSFDVHTLGVDPARVFAASDQPYAYNAETGIFTFEKAASRFVYEYDTATANRMEVTLIPAYTGKATVRLTDPAIRYKGETPYLLYTGSALTPTFEVCDESGIPLDPCTYTYVFENNVQPGTATLKVRFTDSETSASAWFKIFLPPTAKTAVENVQSGIRVSWAPVEGAKGYVIYRRAWSTVTNGWTEFKRWWNVQDVTSWTDGSDESHKVYAGTRYQYGIKAYAEDPMDNYNLGIVGPLKTTVRITTRKLKSVTPGSRQLTVKWEPSKVFTGYDLMLATDADFTKNVKTIKITEALTASNTVTGLKSATIYYVRIRSYQDFEGMTYFGEWSNVIQAKTK